MIQFKDNISLYNYQVDPALKNKFMDTISMDMERQAQDSEVVHGLSVRINATHAARITGHYHYYAPSKLEKAVDTFVSPYNKPVLVHHDERRDAVGRIEASSYIKTMHPEISKALMARAEKDVVHTPETLKYVDALMPFLMDKRFQGLGYASIMANITDYDAIEKIIDGRYLTVSTGYSTDSLHCSICKQDIIKDGMCEHSPGTVYKNKLAFMIFGNLLYDEVSFVNVPADEMAGVVSKKKTVIPVSYNDFKTKDEALNYLSNQAEHGSGILCESPLLYVYDKDSKSYKSILLHNEQGESMKIKDLGTGYDFYQKLTEYLGEENILTKEAFDALGDESFAGTNKTFPAFDAAHIDACKKLLESIEDEGKEDMVVFLTERHDSLDKIVLEETKHEEQETTNTPDVKGKDAMSYAIHVYLEDNPWVETSAEDIAIEEQIMQLLIKKHAAEKADSLDNIFKYVDEKDAVSLITKLATKYQVGNEKDEEITQLKDSIANLKKEYNHVRESRKASDALNEALRLKLKDYYIEKIVASDAKFNNEEAIAKLKSMDSLSLENFLNISSIKNSATPEETLVVKVDSAGESTDSSDEYTQEELNAKIAKVKKVYSDLRAKHGLQTAEVYLAKQMQIINSLKVKKENN